MSTSPQTSGGGDDSSGPSPGSDGGSGLSLSAVFASYLDPRNPNLLAKVDFLGLIGDFGKAGVVAIIAAFIAIPLAVVGALSEVLAAIGFAVFEAPADYFQSALTALQSNAIAVAVGELAPFELFALPVSSVAALAPALVVAVAVALAWGFE